MKHETIPASIEHLDFEHSVPCESMKCEEIGRGSHEADWYVTMDICGHGGAWCNFRFLQFNKDVARGVLLECHICGVMWQNIASWFPVRIS